MGDDDKADQDDPDIVNEQKMACCLLCGTRTEFPLMGLQVIIIHSGKSISRASSDWINII
jgi:hypothetical protein